MRYGILLLFFGFVPALLMGQCTHTIAGLVTDDDTRKPLAGATVTVQETRQQVSTDANGRYRLAGLCDGHFTLVFTHVGCQPTQAHVQVSGDVVQNANLPHTVNQLSEVVVTGSYGTRNASGSAVLSGAKLEQSRGLSLGESLQRLAGVSSLQTGANIYKPVIQGMHSNRVLMLNNGIRQEGQQWGSEHAPEIDPFVANRISVIKGAATLRYGADALGGIVLVEPRLLPAVPGVAGEVSTGFSSNNRLYYVSALAEAASKKHPAFAWRLQGTLRRAGNSKTPDYWLDNSGVREENMSVNAGWRQSHKGLDVFYSLFNTRLGIFSGSHVGNLTDLEQILASGEPPPSVRDAGFIYTIGRPYQHVQHHLVRLKAFTQTGPASRLNLLMAYQFNWRREYDLKRFNSSTDLPQLDIGLNTFTADATWDHFKNEKWRTTLGASGLYQLNDYYQRFFIPNYQMWNAGAFALQKLVLPKWTVEAALRFDAKQYNNITRNSGAEYDDRNFSGTAANLSATWQAVKGLQASATISTTWRSPHVNELFSSGLHHGAARIETGNAGLDAERANSLLLNINYKGSRWHLDVNGFAKRINRFIYLQPQYPPQLTIRGAFPLFSYAQTDARFTGMDIDAEAYVAEHISVSLRGSTVRAWDLEGEDWIIQMPPDQASLGVTFHLPEGSKQSASYAGLSWQLVAQQDRVPKTGNIPVKQPNGSIVNSSDFAEPPAGYGLVHAEMGTRLRTKRFPLSLSVQANNIFNTSYRSYMNAFRYYALDPGFNLALKLRISLQPKSTGTSSI